ncbi:MAG: OmpW family protein [Betaproteobacteria bacterium]|nr:OmpW family protein [Betaproteobacteria bacterium]
MKLAAMAGVAGLALGMVAPVQADQGDWLARARLLQIRPSVSSTIGTLDVSNEITPEVDFSYFFTENIAAELILATQRHTVKNAGADIGKVSHLPPTVTLQYHFMPKETFRPYIGAGLNYTRFYNVSLALGATPLTVDSNSWGGAMQAGFDVALDKKWFLNFDVKKIYIKTDVKNGTTGAFVSTLKIDPVVVGVGVGMKF